MPHKVPQRRRIEIINEILILIAIYNMVLFTPFVTNDEAIENYYSLSFLVIVVVLILLNIIRIFINIAYGI